eukprot:6643398-Pyramimonas_sp.AAC.1
MVPPSSFLRILGSLLVTSFLAVGEARGIRRSRGGREGAGERTEAGRRVPQRGLKCASSLDQRQSTAAPLN